MIELSPGDLTEIAVLGAHCDDIAIGLGGTLLTLAKSHPDLRVHALILSGGGTAREQEERAALAAFCGDLTVEVTVTDIPDGRAPAYWDAIKNTLGTFARGCAPQIVFGPQRLDAHQDHRLLAELIPTEFRDQLILGYEIAKWETDTPTPTTFHPLDPGVAEEKSRLLHEHYRSQVAHDWFDREAFLGLSRLRGLQCRSHHAEAFVVEKSTLTFTGRYPMTIVWSNPRTDDTERRARIYDGQVLVYPASPQSLALVSHARSMILDAFNGLDPELAQFELPVEEFAAILSDLKPRFIHHPDSKILIRELLSTSGCDLDETYFDVPRMRTSTSDDYLTSGISYAFHPHRDTWYSAPFCQINWWIPIFSVVPENVMAFHPRYWDKPVLNGSRRYDYYEWNATSRRSAAQHITSDTRDQPRPEEEIELDPHVRVVPDRGGVMMFSGNQLHSTVPNTSGRTRFSIDFRTINLADVASHTEARNVDSECTGTSMRDFLRASDFERVAEDVAVEYEHRI